MLSAWYARAWYASRLLQLRHWTLCLMTVRLKLASRRRLQSRRKPQSRREPQSQREAWVAARTAAVGERPQDMHFMGACGGSAWAYMRELIADVHAVNPPSADGTSWLERPDWEHRLATVQSVYDDRGARYPKKPWDDDAYRRCEYAVDWAAGEWRVDDSRATEGAKGADTEAACAA